MRRMEEGGPLQNSGGSGETQGAAGGGGRLSEDGGQGSGDRVLWPAITPYLAQHLVHSR